LQLGSSLLAWYDPNDPATVTLNAGNFAQINDKSGNGRHEVQTTAANQPLVGSINGRTAVSATVADRWMVAQFSAITVSGMAAFFVMSRSNIGLPVSIGSSTSAAPFLRLAISGLVSQARGNTGSQVNSPTIAGTQTVPNVVMVAFEGTRVIIGVNGVEQETAGTVNPATFDRFALMTNATTTSLGVTNNMIGNVGECLFVQGVPVPSVRAQIFAYLQQGWGV
jgi:hypothetical protein